MLQLLVPWLFACASCDNPASSASLPWCEVCRESLRSCPPICSFCASLDCAAQTHCLRPWRPFAPELPELPRIEARYLLVGPGYRLLRRWKTRPGRISSRRVLRSNTSAHLEPGSPVLVPVPQRWERSWRLGHQPALEVARALAQERNLEVRPLLELDAGNRREPRQATLGLQQRLGRQLKYRLKPEVSAPRHAIVVDDFLTTGRTARSAAQALIRAGTERVDFFFLGFRPNLLRQERASVRRK
jgi:predicted amidophosphoribosyltransferase